MKDLPSAIEGHKVRLVTYLPCHVPRYHAWMEDPEIRDLTASLRLTLEEEYAMQQTWTNDENKCTFIVLDRSLCGRSNMIRSEDGMAGDVNLFLDGEEAEIDIMIAEKESRRKGLGKEAVILMMQFGSSRLGIKKFIAKISSKNHASLSMFKQLGYVQTGYEEAFEEFVLEYVVSYCSVTSCWQHLPCQLHVQPERRLRSQETHTDEDLLRPFLASFQQLAHAGESERVRTRIDKVFNDQISIVQDMLKRNLNDAESKNLRRKLADKEIEKQRVLCAFERQLAIANAARSTKTA